MPMREMTRDGLVKEFLKMIEEEKTKVEKKGWVPLSKIPVLSTLRRLKYKVKKRWPVS